MMFKFFKKKRRPTRTETLPDNYTSGQEAVGDLVFRGVNGKVFAKENGSGTDVTVLYRSGMTRKTRVSGKLQKVIPYIDEAFVFVTDDAVIYTNMDDQYVKASGKEAVDAVGCCPFPVRINTEGQNKSLMIFTANDGKKICRIETGRMGVLGSATSVSYV